MKQLLLLLLLAYSSFLLGQKKYKNHKFQAEFIALDYFLDSIVPFHEELKDRLLVSQGRISGVDVVRFYHYIPEYKDIEYRYAKWEIEYLSRDPSIPDTLYGGGKYCPRKHRLKRMRYNAYRKRAEAGENISRVSISSMLYDEKKKEELILIGTELKNHPINRIWYVVVIAIQDGEIVYIKEDVSD